MKQLVIFAIQISILCTVFGFGLKAAPKDLLYLVQRPWLLVRSLLAVFVIMPVVAVALVRWFDFRPTVQIVLIALAISPVPPLLPGKEVKGGGRQSYGIELMALLALLSIVMVPLSVELLGALFGRPFAMAPAAIATIVIKMTLLPLAVGMAIRAAAPGIAQRIEKPVDLAAKVLLSVVVVVLLIHAAPALWALIGDWTIVAMAVFVAVGLAVGHVLGRPNPDDAVVLALSTACRHPAIAFSIATANYPNERFGGTILLYLLVSAIISAVYIIWMRRRPHAASEPIAGS
jgi:BASS family bile acid:Na+ symporter